MAIQCTNLVRKVISISCAGAEPGGERGRARGEAGRAPGHKRLLLPVPERRRRARRRANIAQYDVELAPMIASPASIDRVKICIDRSYILVNDLYHYLSIYLSLDLIPSYSFTCVWALVRSMHMARRRS